MNSFVTSIKRPDDDTVVITFHSGRQEETPISTIKIQVNVAFYKYQHEVKLYASMRKMDTSADDLNLNTLNPGHELLSMNEALVAFSNKFYRTKRTTGFTIKTGSCTLTHKKRMVLDFIDGKSKEKIETGNYNPEDLENFRIYSLWFEVNVHVPLYISPTIATMLYYECMFNPFNNRYRPLQEHKLADVAFVKFKTDLQPNTSQSTPIKAEMEMAVLLFTDAFTLTFEVEQTPALISNRTYFDVNGEALLDNHVRDRLVGKTLDSILFNPIVFEPPNMMLFGERHLTDSTFSKEIVLYFEGNNILTVKVQPSYSVENVTIVAYDS